MNKRDVSIMKSVLKDELGFFWFLYLIRALVNKNGSLRGTKWSHDTSTEGQFVRRLSALSSLYSILKKTYDHQTAFRIIGRIIVPTGCCEQWQNLRDLKVDTMRGYERLKAFYDFMGEGGSGQFVQRTLSSNTPALVQYEVRDCLFARFFREMDMIEVASLFCKIDRSFFPTAIPDYRFSRDDSWENTAAYGQQRCIFRFEKIDGPTDEAYLEETPLLDYTDPKIQMLYEQLDLSYKSDEEKIGHFYEYVKSRIRTDRFREGPRPASVVQARGRGNDLDKTILFMALLRAAGIPCRSRVIRQNGRPLLRVELQIEGTWFEIQPWCDGPKGSRTEGSVWRGDGRAKNEGRNEETSDIFCCPDEWYHPVNGR
jgi:hypothetical protein